ncbi:hypothetical protein GCM10007937_24910 [Mesorhizobium albiziae]|nr:hypothetical protein GCM10007937_24910 [Mesorhizobium albiziae]
MYKFIEGPICLAYLGWMSEKEKISRRVSRGELPYEPAYFAEKHGLTLKAAQVILTANGPSRQRCDVAAQAFLVAVSARKRS